MEARNQHIHDLNNLHTEKSSLPLKIQGLEEKLLETQLQLETVMDEKLTHMLSIQKSPTDKTGLRIKGRTKLMEMFWALRSPLPSKNLPYGITVD
jgi:hypothetical protein